MKTLERFVILVIVLLLPRGAEAQDFTYLVSNGNITITGYNGSGSKVVIPSTINGLPVTAIGDFTFFNPFPGTFNTTMTSITIPRGITSIGMDAFLGCINLNIVAIPDTVTNLGDSAFADCYGLTSVIIGNGITSIPANGFADCTNLTSVVMGTVVKNIDQRAFIDCYCLTNVELPDTLTNIGGMAFQFCTSLTNVVIPREVVSFGPQAFCCCYSLTNISLPDGLYSVGDFAFYRSTNLTSIMIPRNVTNIGLGVFSGCLNLAEIDVDPLNPVYSSADGVLFNKAQTELIRYPPAKAGKYWIPSSVTTIGELAFESNAEVTGVLSARLAPNNSFGFTISWPTNAPMVIEATSNLIPPAWSPIGTNTLMNGLTYFTDPQWTNYPHRFYRIRPP